MINLPTAKNHSALSSLATFVCRRRTNYLSQAAKMEANGVSNSKYVTLISRDGFEFVVLRDATMVSPTIKGMLRGPFQEAQTGVCTFPEIRYASAAEGGRR